MAGLSKKPDVCKDGEVVTYDYDAATFKVTDEMKDVFNWDGCIMVRGLLNKDEVAHVEKALQSNPEFLGRAWEVGDGEGRNCRMLLWNQPGHDVTGMVARCEKLVNTCEELIGGEVYHYHTKLMMKAARTGGKHLWHQDYGYWYQNGALRPDMLTVFIPLDKCVKENGCLQVVKGTHRCGRIDHKLIAGQTRADPEQVEHLVQHFDHVYAIMEPGDALFFHCNLLHTSDKNDSDMRRWCFLSAYNRVDNDPVKKHHHPNYTKLNKVPNSGIMECNDTDVSGKDIMDVNTDATIKVTLKETGFH